MEENYLRWLLAVLKTGLTKMLKANLIMTTKRLRIMMKRLRIMMVLITVPLSRAPLFCFPTALERGSRQSNVNDHRLEFLSPLTSLTATIKFNTSYYSTIFLIPHICIDISVSYVSYDVIECDIRSCCLSPVCPRMPDHFVKVTEALTINDQSQIKDNDHLLTLQPKKNTVLVSHGRPPWYAVYDSTL
jgi:hypothetical protein